MTRRTAQYPQAGAVVATLPLRSKLQALLLLLHARYGDSMDAMALELKLQALLRLPDAALAQLLRHPDLVNLSALLVGAFSAHPDMAGVKAELDKIDVRSTSGPTEHVDVVAVNGEPTFVVHSPVAETTAPGVVMARFAAMPQPPVDFVIETPPEIPAPAAMMTTFAAPTVEVYVPAPEPVIAIQPEFAPAPPTVEWVEPSVTSTPPSHEPTTDPEGSEDRDVEELWESVEPEDDDPATGIPAAADPTTGSDDPTDPGEPSGRGEPADSSGPGQDDSGSSAGGDTGGSGDTQGESGP